MLMSILVNERVDRNVIYFLSRRYCRYPPPATAYAKMLLFLYFLSLALDITIKSTDISYCHVVISIVVSSRRTGGQSAGLGRHAAELLHGENNEELWVRNDMIRERTRLGGQTWMPWWTSVYIPSR
jgi:hypothetical protein